MSRRFRVVVGLLAATAFLIGAAAATAGWLFLRGEPVWYTRAGDTSAGDAERVEAQLIHLYNHVAMMHAWRLRQGAAGLQQAASTKASVAVLPADSASGDPPFEVRFTDAELNAFFNKWADTADRRRAMGAYVEDPRVRVRPGGMLLAAKVKQFHTVVSLQLLPELDDTGRLAMNLGRVYGGILPLPEALWAGERDELVRLMDDKYAQLRPTALISPDGTANAAASAAAMNRLLVATLKHRSADPILFLPYDLTRFGRTVPTRVHSIRLEEGTLILTVSEISLAECRSLLSTVGDTPPSPAEATVH